MDIIVEQQMVGVAPLMLVSHLPTNALFDGGCRSSIATGSSRHTQVKGSIYHDHHIDLVGKACLHQYGTLHSYHRYRTASGYPTVEVLPHTRMHDGIDLRSMVVTGKEIGSQHSLVRLPAAVEFRAKQSGQFTTDSRMCSQKLLAGIIAEINRNAQQGEQTRHNTLSTAYAAGYTYFKGRGSHSM